MQETAKELEERAKVKMNNRYDSKAVVRSFNVGEKVLVRSPDWEGKLDEISKKIGPITYQIVVPGRREGRRVIHNNMLKRWTKPDAQVMRLIIIAEENVKTEDPLTDHQLPDTQTKEMEDVLEEFDDLASGKMGKTDQAIHVSG